MDSERCREFVVLAQTCNYLQAADQLFISQSTLSKHIKSLERELDVELFRRTTRRVQLTEQGRVFLPFARKIASAAHDATVALHYARDNERRTLDIGSIPIMVPNGIDAGFIGLAVGGLIATAVAIAAVFVLGTKTDAEVAAQKAAK